MSLNKRYKYIAFFDLDETILNANSASFLVKESRARGIMSKRHYREAIFLSILYKLDWRDATKIIYKMLEWLKGVPRKSIEVLCEDVFKNSMVQLIRPEIIKEFAFHRSNGGAVVLLSSAATFVCIPVVNHLEMEDLICSRMDDADGILTGKPIGNLVFGKEKKYRLLSYCNGEGYDPEDAYYYGDAISDKYVLGAVGHPVCVDPDKLLAREATKRNWRILETG
jgi:HAD superfamily hydrolase (TIGR01490 family)